MSNTREARKTILYIACSLDGFIAGLHDNLDFLSLGKLDSEDYGYNDFEASIDTIILGRKTFDWIMKQVDEYPFSHLETYVLSRKKKLENQQPCFYNGDPSRLINDLKSKPGKNIFINGGASIVTALMRQHLIDEYILFIFPVFLGEGVRLFRAGRPEQKLKLLFSHTYTNGVVKVHYSCL